VRHALIALTLLVAACQKATPPPDLALLASAPADTPYLFAMLEPIPRAYWDTLGSLTGDLDKLIDTALAEPADASDEDRLGKAVLRTLKGNLDEAGIRKLTGIGPGARFVVYGVGLYPVMRVELEDDKALVATIDRLTKEAGVANPVVEHQGRKYWRFDLDDVVIAVAVADRQLVFSGAPKDRFEDELLPNLLGLEKPAKSVLQANTLAPLIAKHKLGPWAGYVDTALLVERTKHLLAPACATSLGALTRRVPRAVLGYDRWTGGPFTGRMIVELDDALATRLTDLVVEIPGFPSGKGAKPSLMTLGAGVNLEKGRLLLLDGTHALAGLGASCGEELTREAKEMSEALAQPLPPGLDKVQGFVVSVLSAKFGHDGPGDVHGYAILASTDPGAVLDKIGALLPFPADKLPRDGKFHEILPAGSVPMLGAVQAAVESKAILVATGTDGPAAATRALGSEGPAPLFYLEYDYGAILKLMLDAMPAGGPEQAFIQRLAQMVGVVSMSFRPTQAGLVLETSFDFR
jgi:hypothetical protein